jgi:hypothetical protein
MLFFHPGTKRQSKLFTCKLVLRTDRKRCFREYFYSADNKRFESMADVARFLNLSPRIVSLNSPSKKISGEKEMRLDPNKKDQMVGGNNTKEIGEVGYKFRKQFGSMGWFTGTVVEIIPKSYLRRCVYTENGEFEDLRVVDLAKLDNRAKRLKFERGG